MKGQGNEKLNPLEGAATLSGVRYDNLSQEVNPSTFEEEIPRFPENPSAEAVTVENDNGKRFKGESTSGQQATEEKLDKPVSKEDITGKQVDDYYNNTSKAEN